MIRHNDPASLGTKAELAFEDACRNVIERARVSNTKIVICRDGIVVKLTPDEAEQELEVNLAKRQDKLLSLIGRRSFLASAFCVLEWKHLVWERKPRAFALQTETVTISPSSWTVRNCRLINTQVANEEKTAEQGCDRLILKRIVYL